MRTLRSPVKAPAAQQHYEANLRDKMKDKAFVTDIRSLLATGLDYDPREAAALVQSQLVARLF